MTTTRKGKHLTGLAYSLRHAGSYDAGEVAESSVSGLAAAGTLGGLAWASETPKLTQ